MGGGGSTGLKCATCTLTFRVVFFFPPFHYRTFDIYRANPVARLTPSCLFPFTCFYYTYARSVYCMLSILLLLLLLLLLEQRQAGSECRTSQRYFFRGMPHIGCSSCDAVSVESFCLFFCFYFAGPSTPPYYAEYTSPCPPPPPPPQGKCTAHTYDTKYDARTPFIGCSAVGLNHYW